MSLAQAPDEAAVYGEYSFRFCAARKKALQKDVLVGEA
jgi:hypothetical protein